MRKTAQYIRGRFRLYYFVKAIRVKDFVRLEGLKREYIIPLILPQVGRIALCGVAKHGKSFLALQLAMSVSQGRPFLGFAVTHPGPVLYLQLDTPAELWQERVASLEQAGILVDPDDSHGLYVIHPSTQPRSVNILSGHDARNIHDMITATLPVLVVVDVLRSVHRLSENESEHMQQVIGHLSTVCQGRSLLIVHHTGKPSTDPKAVRRSPSTAGRGSSYLGGEMDANWLLHGSSRGHASLEIEARFAAPDEPIRLVQNSVGLWNRTAASKLGRPPVARTAYQDAIKLDPELATLSVREASERTGIDRNAIQRERQTDSK